MVQVTIRLLDVRDALDANGQLAYLVNFKVMEWPELGDFAIIIPRTYTQAQARVTIENYVRDLKANQHEWYGIEWTMTL